MLGLCANQHFSSISMRQLAAACDVNMALVYHYFDSKKGLVHAALRYAIDDFLVEFDDLPKDVDAPLGAGDVWIKATMDAAPRLMRMVKLMADFSAQDSRDPDAMAMIDEFYGRERDTLKQAIEDGMAAGKFRKVNAERTARLTSIAIDGVFFGGPARNDYDYVTNLQDLRDQLLDYLQPG
ncbi:MAG: hypothetical protein CML66_18505 [Rhodobacteraceae bacterium]|nr:hypothetical protein [Paracoccaceae bacterium]MAY44314.1 hypothetical protein [Paracoccaceae bacterium]